MSAFILLVFLGLLTIAGFTGIHAAGQGKSGVFWFVVVFLLGLIGLVAYAISLASD
jgi:hypothetical protein